MGDTRRVVQALDGVQRHTRGRRFFRVPVLRVARSREADSLAELWKIAYLLVKQVVGKAF